MHINDIIKRHNHICWYPSAGIDFREMLYLSNAFYGDYSNHFERSYPTESERIIPDLFILTDKAPTNIRWVHNDDYIADTDIIMLQNDQQYKKVRKLFKDLSKTSICAKNEPIRCSGNVRAYYMPVNISSKWYGHSHSWNAKLLYVFSDNQSFYNECLLKNKATVEVIINIRMEELLTIENGERTFDQLKNLKSRYYIAEHQYVELVENASNKKLTEIYSVPGSMWSGRNDIVWCKV